MLTDNMASNRTVALWQYIQGNAGKSMMLAQQESPQRMRHDQEMEYLQVCTGKLPLIRGLDFIHDDYAGVVERAKRWNDQGGIVTICWHTGVAGKGYPESKQEQPDFELLLKRGTKENDLLRSRWQDAAMALRQLAEQDIPVLWRPFHEFDGAWFWWGKGGAENFKLLWRMMADTFRNEYELHNLIWVLGYADDVPDGWYPGDDYCDILGSDTYRGETTHAQSFQRLRSIHSSKPLAFHECGVIPLIDRFYEDQAVWSYLMPWHGRWLMEDNKAERLKSVYADPRTLTLDDGGTF